MPRRLCGSFFIMLRHTKLTLTRILQVAPRIKAQVYAARLPLDVRMAGPVGRIPFAQAAALNYEPVERGEILQPYGATFWFRLSGTVPAQWAGRRVDLLWASHSEATLWRGGQPVQGLNFEPANSTCLRPDAKLWDSAEAGAQVDLYVEVACNQLNGYNWKQVPSYQLLSPFVFEQADIAMFDAQAWKFYHDYLVLADLLRRTDPEAKTAWGGHLLATLNEVVNILRLEDRSTWEKPQQMLEELLACRNGTIQHEITAIGHGHIDTGWLWPIAETRRKCVRTFTSALAYAEDYPEYRFVCSQAQQYEWVRQEYPELFARMVRAAQQGTWVPVGGTWIEPDCNLPSGESLVRQFLYGQRFFERYFGQRCTVFWNPDVFGYSGALPQIIRGCGIKYFLTQKLSWNQFTKPLHHNFYWEGIDGTRVLSHFPPADSYNAMWNGTDFPLGDILHNVNNFKDHDLTAESLFVFGYGDGGGGPTREMLEVLRRLGDLQGVPRVEQRTPEAFFKRLEASLTDAPVCVGELYFEYHRGTYTTQADVKLRNRRNEFLLREVEMLSAVAARVCGADYPHEELERLWRLLLLNQFHDIIPGSSIREVYEDTAAQYSDVEASGAALRAQALQSLLAAAQAEAAEESAAEEVEAGEAAKAEGAVLARELAEARAGSTVITATAAVATDCLPERAAFASVSASMPAPAAEHCSDAVWFNQLGWERTVLLPQGADGSAGQGLFRVAGMGLFALSQMQRVDAPQPARATHQGADFVLENAFLRARFSAGGVLLSLTDKEHGGREVIAEGSAANQFVIYEDYPHDYDAWEVDPSHLETRESLPAARSIAITCAQGLSAGLELEIAFGRSVLRQRISLDAHERVIRFDCEADWRERHRFLKVEFPVQVRSAEASFEIQFGHVKRPTHFNSIQDIARFESCAHKWVDLSQPDYGVALLNDCKYGCAVHGSTLRLSLLRAPTYPDPEADQGVHRFSYGLYPHSGDLVQAGVVRKGFEFNCPPVLAAGAQACVKAVQSPSVCGGSADSGANCISGSVARCAAVAGQPWLSIDTPNLIIDTVKKAEDGSGLIVRLYECHGTAGTALLRCGLPWAECTAVTLLEDALPDGSPAAQDPQAQDPLPDVLQGSLPDGCVRVPYRPFQIISLRFD